jgi:hypothetical protein
MTNEIGNIIIEKIEELQFIDKYAGVVQILSYVESGKTKKFPAALNLTIEECTSGRYKDLCPESSKKSVLFLEDKGARPESDEGGISNWVASYDLVCWLNNKKLGSTIFSGTAIAQILKKFPSVPFNSGIFQKVLINVTAVKPKSYNPFIKYTINEEITQYLMWPYELFTLEIEVSFSINKNCIEIEELNPEIPC